MVQAFREAKFASREEFLAAFEAMVSDRFLAWNYSSDIGTLVSDSAERFGVQKGELQRIYWEKAAKPELARKFSGDYFRYGELMNPFKMLKMLGESIPESILKDAEPFFSRFLDQELKSGFLSFDSLSWLLPLAPVLDAKLQAKIGQISVAFAESKSDEFRSGYPSRNTQGPELEFLVSTLVSNSMVDDVLANCMMDYSIASIVNINPPASLPILRGLEWKLRENDVYMALLLGAANSSALRSFIFGADRGQKDLLSIISAIDEKAKLPPHIAFLAEGLIQLYKPSEAVAAMKQHLATRATSLSDNDKAIAKTTLEDAITKAATSYRVNAQILVLAGNLVTVYNANFGSLKSSPALEDALKLARSALQNPETYEQGYALAAVIYGGEAGIDKLAFGSVANIIPSLRTRMLEKHLRGPRRQQSDEYGNALEKTSALTELVMLHEFLERKFGTGHQYKLVDEIKALAPQIGPEADAFVVQYFSMAVQAHKEIHDSPLGQFLPQNLTRIAAAIIDKLQRARNNPRLREMNEERRLLERIYKNAYSALFGHDIDNAKRLNPAAFAFLAQTPIAQQSTTQRYNHTQFRLPVPPVQQRVPLHIQYVTLYLGGRTVEGDAEAPRRMMQAARAKASTPLELITATTQVGGNIPPGTAGIKLKSAGDYAAIWGAVQGSVRAVEVYGGNVPGEVLEACHLKASNSGGRVIITTANNGVFAIYQLRTLERVFTPKPPAIPHASQQQPRYIRR